MKVLFRVILFLSIGCGVNAATLTHHPHWKSDRLPNLYYEVLARAVEQEVPLQAQDGRFRQRLPEAGDDELSWRVVGMQFIYAPALLYVSDHPSNSLYQDPQTLEMAVRAGDYLATCITESGEVIPRVNGKPTNPLDSHRFLYCWIEAFELLREHLDEGRLKTWEAALKRAGKDLVLDLEPRIGRPKHTSPFLGYSPNHFGLRASTIWRMGMVLGVPEWVSLTTGPIQRFTRMIQPGGYWEEHNGPTMNYDYLNTSVAALNWRYTSDPGAWAAIKASTDFHSHWCTPDGVDIHTIDQRNRSHFRPGVSFGLMSFTHFPEGRRWARFKLLAALGEDRDPLGSLGLSSLGRIAQNLHYYEDGPEAPIPQEAVNYRHELDRPAVVQKKGPWVYSISGLVSPERPLSQFYLDRTGPVSLWHEQTRHIIGGGNSKGQPQLATFSVKRGDGSWSHLPLDMLLESSDKGDTLCVAHEGFSLRLTISVQDEESVQFIVDSERTYNRLEDTAFLNLPLVVRSGETISTGGGDTRTLSAETILLDTGTANGSVSYGKWKVSMPEETSFEWPVYTYSPYGSVRVPKNLRNALAVLSVELSGREESKVIRFSVD
jgi:hypothetical protein